MPRRALVPVVLLAVAGCFGSPGGDVAGVSHDHSRAEGPPPGVLRIIIVDEEFVPIPDATVWLPLRNESAKTDAFGVLTVTPVDNGSVPFRAWHPLYYRDESAADAVANQTVNATLRLRRVPDGVWELGNATALGYCWFGYREDGTTDLAGCMPPPNIVNPYTTVTSHKVGPIFWNLTYEARWEPFAEEARLGFVASLLNGKNFSDGGAERYSEGARYVRMDFDRTDFAADALLEKTSLVIASVPPTAQPVSFTFLQPYDIAYRWANYIPPPPNPSWGDA